ncbi:protein-tyrosine-phosphatase [Pycnococcus provasolii]|uniref:Protein-tyrosine-phosphatase n=1 Tax=Pycnococcus provasolii TaxID=41880 RepID=A0A830HT96_9CHLO|nr:protein-tyrosine-phosphatase [Pycnococcus provasolii]
MPLISSKKRERENPCFICGHYHRYDLGEICKICGHKPPGPAAPAACSVGGGVGTNPTFVGNAFVDGAMNASQSLGFCPTVPLSSNGNSSGAGGGQLLAAAHEGLPSEVIPSFLYLGSYDHASRSDLLKAMDVHYVLNCVPGCQNLYRNSFTYHTATTSSPIPLGECIGFLESVRKAKGRVLVHCMSGMSRSPAVVLAYLLYLYGSRIRLPELHNHLKSCRQVVNLKPVDMAAVSQYEEAREAALASGDATQAQPFVPDSSMPPPVPLPSMLPNAAAMMAPLSPPAFDFAAAAPPPPSVSTDAFAAFALPTAAPLPPPPAVSADAFAAFALPTAAPLPPPPAVSADAFAAFAPPTTFGGSGMDTS